MEQNSSNKLVEIYIDLPEEGSPTIRPTQAIDMGNGVFKVLPTPNYDPEDEVWQFPPGSLVRCKTVKEGNEEYLVAVQSA